MLSKKMAFSLTSLITIFALAFVVSTAMAAEFAVKVEGPSTVNETGEKNVSAKVTLKITADQPVGDITVKIVVFDKNGLLVDPYNVMVKDDLDFAEEKTAKVRQLTVDLPKVKEDEEARLPYTIYITVPVLTTIDPTVAADATDHLSKAVIHKITLSAYADTTLLPKVVSIQRLRPGSQTVVAAFQEQIIPAEPFDVRIVTTEFPHGPDYGADINNLIAVENGTLSNLVVGVPFERFELSGGKGVEDTIIPHPKEGMYEHSTDGVLAGVPPGVAGSGYIPMPTGPDAMYHQYRVTVTPHQKPADFDVKIGVKSFHDNGSLVRNVYVPAGLGDSSFLPNGRQILTIRVAGAARDLTAGYRVILPKDIVIPKDGYLIVTQNNAGSEVVVPPGKRDESPKATDRIPVQMFYNVYEAATLPNLATAFLNGVVLDVESQHPGLVVSEVMWGEDVSLDPSSNSQYIELYNPGDEYKTVGDADHTPDINEALTLIFYAPNEFESIPAGTADALPTGITDRIGTLDATGDYWSPANVGQSGRSGTSALETADLRGDFVASVPIVSMYREMVPSLADGQLAASWLSSHGPKSANFDPLAIGVRYGTPGAATDATVTPADTAASAQAEADALQADADKIAGTGTMPENGQIYISEIMFAGGGTLPQWIEISNGSRTEEVNLSNWTLTVDNAIADTDVSVDAAAKFTIPKGTTISMSGQDDTPSTILVVTEKGRNNLTGAKASGQVINLEEDNEVDLIQAGVLTGKYTLLSSMAFEITLAPPEPAATKPPATETVAAKATRQAAEKKAKAKRVEATDIVGNLGADGAAAWVLPMDEDVRSSIIRSHVQVARGPAEPEDGEMMDSWVLASETAFAQVTHIRASSYYGSANDVGTPGFRPGGALPVELSHFSPARDKVSGAVVITWSTQSELNNAGFFIKRSNQRDGEFTVINAAMIPGAGTTSEKQSYTFEDSTAEPNIVYYYQIEDVSFDGNRQTLTRGIRLKGHVGAAGKATVTWGELKTSHE